MHAAELEQRVVVMGVQLLVGLVVARTMLMQKQVGGVFLAGSRLALEVAEAR